MFFDKGFSLQVRGIDSCLSMLVLSRALLSCRLGGLKFEVHPTCFMLRVIDSSRGCSLGQHGRFICENTENAVLVRRARA